MTSNPSAASGVLDGASCIARMQTLRDSLTPGQRQLVDTVLADPHAVILASVAELSKRSGSSEAAVSRFSRALGYGSYAEFKLALSRDLIGTPQFIHEDVEPDDPVDVVAEKVATANIRAVQDTLRALDMDDLKAAARELDRALTDGGRVAFFGFGGSAIVARDAWHHYLRTGRDIVWIEDSHEQVMWATTARPDDVIVLFSHTGTSRDLCDVAEIARPEGAFTISVTNHGISPLAEACDLNLFTSSRETRFREESMSSRIAAMTIIDILFVFMSMRFSDEVAARMDNMRRALARKRI